MIPKYPFMVRIEYQANRNRKPVEKHCETLQGAMAIFNENVGRQDVRRVSVHLVIESVERWEQVQRQQNK